MQYFDTLPNNQNSSQRPLPSFYVQQQMNNKNWSDPQVRAYLDANQQYYNSQTSWQFQRPVQSPDQKYLPCQGIA